jgi:hypothetical protein
LHQRVRRTTEGSVMPYPTASVEILEGDHMHVCDVCRKMTTRSYTLALYNVFDGNGPLYACGRHLGVAVRRVATRKGG